MNNDAQDEVQNYLANDGGYGPLEEIFSECSPDNPDIQEIKDLIEEGEAIAAQEICEDYTALTGNPSCDESTIYSIPQETVTDEGVERTIEDCATLCRNEGLRSVSSDIMSNYETYVTYVSIVDNEIIPLLDCEPVRDALTTGSTELENTRFVSPHPLFLFTSYTAGISREGFILILIAIFLMGALLFIAQFLFGIAGRKLDGSHSRSTSGSSKGMNKLRKRLN